MLKLLGAAAVFISCTSVGFYKSYRVKKRCDSLSALILCIKQIGAATAFSKSRVEIVFNNVARDYNMPIFSDAAASVKKLGVQKAWRESLKEYSYDLALCERDISAAMTLASFSEYSGIEQQKCISTCERLMELSLNEARGEYERTAKLFGSSGVLVGMLAVIMLL